MHQKHGAYHYDLGRDEHGKRRWVKLCRISDGQHTLYSAIAELKKPRAHTLGDGFDAFLGSKDFAKLAPRTQKDYLFYINGADGTGKLRQTFQHAAPELIVQGHIAQYLYERSEDGAPALANKEMACLSSTYNYMMRAGLHKGANPCKGVRRNTVKPRTRYPDDDEFMATFVKAPEAFQDFIAGLHLTGLRQIDLRRARKAQIVDGKPRILRLQETKRGKLLQIEISEELGAVIDRACARAPKSPFIWTNSRGEPWTHDAIQSASQRLKKTEKRDWTLHDVRAKAESDSAEGLGLLPLYRRARRIKAVR